MKIMVLLFLGIASWQDLKSKKIQCWVFALFAAVLVLSGIIWKQTPHVSWKERIVSVGIGFVLLGISKWSRGAIGEGDGWAFVVSGLALSFGDNLGLLSTGLILSCCYSLGVVAWGCFKRVSIRRMTIPFLPFLLPFGIWLVLV